MPLPSSSSPRCASASRRCPARSTRCGGAARRNSRQERVRLTDATARERQNVLDRTRREIDLQFRVAHRALVEHTADLSMRLARTRIERDITPDDQRRLIDRYATEVRA